MNLELRQPVRAAKSRIGIVDCDVHPRAQMELMRPYLSDHWWRYLETYGIRQRHGFAKGYPYPKGSPLAARRDAWPPTGGPPASDLDFLRQQHLDFYDIDYAVLTPLSP